MVKISSAGMRRPLFLAGRLVLFISTALAASASIASAQINVYLDHSVSMRGYYALLERPEAFKLDGTVKADGSRKADGSTRPKKMGNFHYFAITYFDNLIRSSGGGTAFYGFTGAGPVEFKSNNPNPFKTYIDPGERNSIISGPTTDYTRPFAHIAKSPGTNAIIVSDLVLSDPGYNAVNKNISEAIMKVRDSNRGAAVIGIMADFYGLYYGESIDPATGTTREFDFDGTRPIYMVLMGDMEFVTGQLTAIGGTLENLKMAGYPNITMTSRTFAGSGDIPRAIPFPHIVPGSSRGEILTGDVNSEGKLLLQCKGVGEASVRIANTVSFAGKAANVRFAETGIDDSLYVSSDGTITFDCTKISPKHTIDAEIGFSQVVRPDYGAEFEGFIGTLDIDPAGAAKTLGLDRFLNLIAAGFAEQPVQQKISLRIERRR